jgi:hypothetical protein
MIVNPHGRDSKGRFLKGKKYRKNPTRHAGKKRRHARRRNPSAAPLALLGNPKRHHRRRFRRNPFGGTLGEMLAPIGGGAAVLGADWLIGLATQARPDLQLRLQTGFARPAINAAAGLGLGVLVGTLLKQPKIGAHIAAGGLAVAGYNLLRLVVIKVQPAAPLPLGEVEEYPALAYWNAAQPLDGDADLSGGELGPGNSLSEFLPSGGSMGEFLPRGDGMGAAADDELSEAEEY